ncbi:MAG: type II toxin-antitoxin system Phd/YefM family antitoxin [Ardenticatenaceae bacterium]
MNAVTLNYAQQNLGKIIDKVISDVEPTIVCTDTNQRIRLRWTGVVLLPLDEFNSWQETRYLLSNPANAQHLQKSIRQATMGQTQKRELIEA